MRRAAVSFLCLALVLPAAPVPAYVLALAQSSSSGKWYPFRWPDGAPKVQFMMPDTPLDLLPNILSDRLPTAAVMASLATWDLAPPGFYLGGTVAKTDAIKDGVNLITFADTPRNRDLVSDGEATTLPWLGPKRTGDSYWPITEVDIVLSPAMNWGTDGRAGVQDIQDDLVHELGHAHGLGHSAVAGATMWPNGPAGETCKRSLELDDIAGIRALYNLPTPGLGAIAGQVLTTDGKPVFGAHVVATGADTDGIVPVGVLTDKDGAFTLPSLPPGPYFVYAEPLNQPETHSPYPEYFKSALVDFQTMFAGGNARHQTVQVPQGQTISLDPIRVEVQPATLRVEHLGTSPDGNSFSNVGGYPLCVQGGDSLLLVAVGEGLDQAGAIGASGFDISFDGSQVNFGTTTTGYPFVIIPMFVRAGARPGVRNLYFYSGDEQVAFTGAFKVVAP